MPFFEKREFWSRKEGGTTGKIFKKRRFKRFGTKLQRYFANI
jgi:hypothetical protein